MRVLGAALCALFGALFLVIYNDHPDWAWGWRAALLILAFAMGLLMLMFILQAWLMDIQPLIDEHKRTAAYIKAITPETEYVRQLAMLQPYQAEVWLKRSAALVNVPGVAGPIEYYRFDDVDVPAEFVEQFIGASDERGLYAVRNYSEGSVGRDWAIAITDFYVKRGLARPAVGNLPATWTYGRAQALRWIGWTMEEDSENV